MKEKPHRHRLTNTFRFQSFHKKVKSIKVSSRSFIIQRLKNEADSETEFVKALQKWQEFNLTKGFKDFRRDVGDDIHSLSQLLLNEKRVIAALEGHLDIADNLSLNPLLHALVAFATDLPEHFFKNYFYSFLHQLRKHLATRCHDVIENVFVCYISLFTLGQKYIKVEIVKLYHEEDYAQLLSKSYPWYINELAAQSLGFLIRKLPNQRNFFSMAFGKLKKDETQKEGLGRLIFHTMKSDVTRRLHSSSSNTLSVVLDVIREANIPLQPSLEAIEYSFHKLIEHVTSKSEIEEEWKISWKEDSQLIWPTLWDKVTLTIENFENADSDIYLDTLLQAIYKLIQYKHAILVLDAEFVIDQLVNAISKASSDATFLHINSILIKLMLSSHHDLSQNTLIKVLENVISLKAPSHVVFTFIEQLGEYPQFDGDVLPIFLRYVNSLLMENADSDVQKETLASLVNLISSKQSPIMAGGDLESWRRFPLNFSLLRSSALPVSTLMDTLLSQGLQADCSNCENIILASICIPHISPINYEDFMPSLFYILNDALDLLLKGGEGSGECVGTSDDASINYEMLLCLLGYVIEAIYHILQDEDFFASFSDINLFSLLLNADYKENIYLLKAANIYVQVISRCQSNDNEECISFRKAYELLSPMLASPKPLVRLLVSKTLSYFRFEDSDNIFSLMVEAESVPMTPWEYKERLRILNKLDYDHINHRNIDYAEAPLLFLIGQLHINFKEIWPPVRKHISSFAINLIEGTFWPMWMSHLKVASESALKELCGDAHDDHILEFEDPILSALHSTSLMHSGFASLPTKPSYLHFRDQLWLSMIQFPDICERRNREVVSLFFDFLYQEYFPIDVNVAPTQNIGKHLKIEDGEGENETMDDSEDIEAEEGGESETDPRVRKAPTGTLCNHISLFTKFRNPKSMHRSKDLLEIYKEFLSHPYMPVQKLALDAIMSYNFKHLNPYRDSLYKILDDKTFKDEIALFSIDGISEDECRSLKDEHRNDFMPILMKILYGKMLYKTGTNSSGKGKSSLRKSIVIRFLAGASESELSTFLNLTFDVFLSHLEGTSLDVVKRVMSSIDPKEVVPLKRIHGAFRTLETIIDKLGNLVYDKRDFLFKVLLFILSTSATLLERRDEVSHHYYSLLKNLRQMSLQKIISFFQVYKDYAWNSDELEALYLTGVWPALPRLPDEGIYNTTTLMKLFLCWADNPRYHTLLARCHSNDPCLTPIPFVMKLIHHPKCSDKVIDASFTLIERLLNKLDSCEMDESSRSPIPFIQEFQLDVETHGKERGLSDLTFGEYLVAMHLDPILQVMRTKLSGESVNKKELAILIHIASWIKSEQTGEEFLTLIVPLLSKNSIKDEEKVCYLLEICSNLLHIVQNPEKHLNAFLHMFSVFNGRHQRDSLTLAINAIAQRIPLYSRLSSWSTKLNAWNPKMAEEIDFEIRLSCFKEINHHLESCTELREELSIFLVNNNMWSLKEIEDSAIRDSSLLCLQNLIKAISRIQPTQGPLAKTLMEVHFLPPIKTGLKHGKENVRDDMMILLHTASINCHNFVHRLEDLFKLADLDEIENDFFLSMSHIQRHRRARALNKLCERINHGAISLEKETIVEFLLPLASSFLFKDEYAKDDYLIASAISTMGSLAKQLNWFHYQNLLKFYLNFMSRELKYLKLGVRVLEVIIDAFHEKLDCADRWKVQKDLAEGQNLASNSAKIQANKVYRALTTVFIPQIQHTLSSRSLRDTEHKVNKKKYPEEDDIRRIPLALALVKLLKKLPRQVLDSNVNSVLMKLITYLKSRSDSIRQEARDMLVKVMAQLGGRYFSNLVKDMNILLTRGFQCHVLVFTLHAVLSELQTDLLPEHFDGCLQEVMELCIEDLFGERAQEKEVAQITSKYKEAKVERSLAIIGIASQIISTDHLEMLILPLKNSLQTHNKKVINKVTICLQKVASGLERNPNISLDQKAIFLYGVLNEKIKEISLLKEDAKAQEKKDSPIQRPDSFLILPEPRKVGLKPKTSPKDTSYVLVEFSLKLLHILLRHEYFEASNSDHCGYLDPFVPIVKKCVMAEYPEINVYAIHIFSWLLKYPLPSLKEQLQHIVSQMYVILNKYSSTNLTKGKAYELVQLVFKTLSVILRDYSDVSFETDHIHILIHYARDNLEDYDQHHSTFTILQALIHRKIHIEELHNVMISVKELSITSTNVNMLDQARCCYFKYIMNYPKQKKQHISTLQYYLTNLSYPIPEGQLSAILMINDILSKYPQNLFSQEIEQLACFKLTEQIVCQDSKEHKRLLIKALKTLYLKSERKEILINLCLKLFDSSKTKNRSEEGARIHMGAQAFGVFLDAPQNAHPSLMFSSIAPKVVQLLHPGRFKVYSAVDDELIEERQLAVLDSSLNSLLKLLSKLIDVYMTQKTMTLWNEHVDQVVWDYIKEHLLYPNLQTRLLASSIVSCHFGHYPLENDELPLLASTSEAAKILVLDLCEQLATESAFEQTLLDQLALTIVRNLVYIVRLSEKMCINPTSSQTADKDESDVDEDLTEQETHSNLDSKENNEEIFHGALWVLQKVRKLAHRELRLNAKSSTLCREALLNLIAGIIVVLRDKFVQSSSLVSLVLDHVVRELSDEHLPETLDKKTKELASLVKENLGVERYSEESVKAQLILSKKKTERRAKERERVITNPQLAMKRRAKKHAAKKVSKKRKLFELKLKPNKKRRLRDMALVLG